MNSNQSIDKKVIIKRRSFTMMELIAVIAISAILMGITVKIMRTDSSKANAQTFGSFMNYCQASAMSYGNAVNYIMVEMNVAKNTHGQDQLLNVSMYNSTRKAPIIATTKITKDGTAVKVQSFAPGSRTLKSDGTEHVATFYWYYNAAGEPVNDVGTTVSSGYSLWFKSRSSTSSGLDGAIPVVVKPFTGKVNYYTP